MENKRTILLTGSSGFLGTRILSKINKNDTVYLLSNKNSVSTLNPNHFEITINELDNFAKFDKIIHCAGRTKGNASDIWESNYQLTKKLISISEKNRTYFLFISTLNAGLNQKGPIFFGSVAITIRLKPNQSCQKIHASLRELYDPSKVARIEKWVANEEPEDTARAEEKIRGPDKKIGTCFMLETIRKEDAISILEQLPTQTLQVEIGIYQLLCEYPKAIKA